MKENYFRKISSLIEGDIVVDNFIELECSDSIISTIYGKINSEKSVRFNTFEEIINRLKDGLLKKDCYILIDRDWRYCGIYKVERNFTCKKAYDFIGLKTDDIKIIAIDLSLGIHIEYCHDSVTDAYRLSCKLLIRS